MRGSGEPGAALRPASLLTRSADDGRDQLDAFGRSEIDREAAIVDNKSIGDEMHKASVSPRSARSPPADFTGDRHDASAGVLKYF